MTIALAAVAAQGCICVCGTAEVDFAAACTERGGQVQRSTTSHACVVDAGVVATWIDDDAGDPP